MSAAGSSAGPDAPVSFRASWGAARATNQMGPVTAVAKAARATLMTSNAVRVRATPTPSAMAVVSPISTIERRRERARARGSSTARATRMALACGQPRLLRLPISQAWASSASCQVARVIRYELTARSRALTPMPTTTSRKPCSPLPSMRRYMATAMASPPISAPTAIWVMLPCSTMMTTSAPTAEPLVKPMMSGLPRALPVRLCRIAPLTASAAPTHIAVSMRGIRRVLTMKSAPPEPLPTTAWRTSPTLSS